jgi:GNAT superfamily N-acetyltransferase
VWTIRRATPDDARAIGTVHVSSWRTTYPGIVDQSYIDTLSVDARTAAWLDRLGRPDETGPDVLIAESALHGLVGFVSGGHIREPRVGFDAELHAIYLLKEHQGAGLGRRLVHEWAALALARGLHAAVVRVLAANPACAFYEQLGAELIREASLTIGGKQYPERWYGWRDLGRLTTAPPINPD